MQVNGSHPSFKGYPLNADTVWRYVTMLKEFPGEVKSIPSESLGYFFTSPSMNQYGKSILPSQVEVDLSRFYSVRLNEAVLYDKRKERKTVMTASEIFCRLQYAFEDTGTALNCSKLLTQATFAEPAIDFNDKFAHLPLKYTMTNQFTTDIIVHTCDRESKPLKTVPLYFHMILAIRDLSKLDQVATPEELFIQGYCVISRSIKIPRESIKLGLPDQATIEDSYSKFFETEKEAFEHLDALIAEQGQAPLPEYVPGGYCIIA